MVGSGRLIGLVLIGFAFACVLVSGVWVLASMNQPEGGLQAGGAALTIALAVLVALVIGGFGAWFLMQGRTEAAQFAEVEKQKRILNMVHTQGTVPISSIALELNMPLDAVKAAIYDLVGKGLFTGYVDWKGGKLVSQDAAIITQEVTSTGKCPNCGAPLSVGGKGVIRCDYCGAEIFLPQS